LILKTISFGSIAENIVLFSGHVIDSIISYCDVFVFFLIKSLLAKE